jgi:hypothetical protein
VNGATSPATQPALAIVPPPASLPAPTDREAKLRAVVAECEAKSDPTPYEKRKLSEALRELAKLDRARKRAARASQPATPTATQPATAPAPSTDALPERTTEQRAKDCVAFLRAVFRIAAFVAPLFGYTVRPLEPSEAKDDAGYWTPLAERYLFFDRLITWLGAPVALVERLAAHMSRKDVPPPPPPDAKREAS